MSSTNKTDTPTGPADLVKALVDVSYHLNTLAEAIPEIRECVELQHNPEYLNYRLLAASLTAATLLSRLVQMQIILAGKA